MEKGPSLDADSRSSGLEMSCILRKPNLTTVFACHWSLSWLSRMPCTPYSLKIHFNITLTFTPRFLKQTLPIRFFDRKFVSGIYFSMPATCLAQIILSDVTIEKCLKTTVFWDATMCSLVEVYRRFRDVY
jgi:hypothetical protein